MAQILKASSSGWSADWLACRLIKSRPPSRGLWPLAFGVCTLTTTALTPQAVPWLMVRCRVLLTWHQVMRSIGNTCITLPRIAAAKTVMPGTRYRRKAPNSTNIRSRYLRHHEPSVLRLECHVVPSRDFVVQNAQSLRALSTGSNLILREPEHIIYLPCRHDASCSGTRVILRGVHSQWMTSPTQVGLWSVFSEEGIARHCHRMRLSE